MKSQPQKPNCWKKEVRQLMRLHHYPIHTERRLTQLVVKLLYGSGLRIMEALRLRVKDLDLQMRQVTVRSGKGDKDRFTTLSAAMIPLLENHLQGVKAIHQADLAGGHGEGYLPDALERK